MFVKHASEVSLEPVRAGIGIRWLIANRDGALNFAMRVIEIEPGVVFDPHTHAWEHEIFVLEGAGAVIGPDGSELPMVPGSALFVPPDEAHGYRNTGNVTLKFICVIPSSQ
ncbi:MAG: cupin domain-containing protein [Anaerolineae bacterium]|nr:cupin domain-containing protein [Anaerolineae bacterium]